MTRPRRLPNAHHPSARLRAKTIAILTPDGPVYLIVDDPKVRSRIAKHRAAAVRYTETGDPRGLKPFRRRYLLLSDGSRLAYATDLAAIDRIAEGGEMHYEMYRR